MIELITICITIFKQKQYQREDVVTCELRNNFKSINNNYMNYL